jgi:tRNA(fMet)-specific endonuclease VapC
VIYLLDTNTVSDLLKKHPPVLKRTEQVLREGHTLCLCLPVHYEILRGLFKNEATKQLQIFSEQLVPLFDAVRLEEQDWFDAAQLWALTQKAGKQLSDVDLLIAALAKRLDATIVSDADFDVLSVTRNNWRDSFSEGAVG